MINVEKTYADAAALAAWLTNLAADITAGRVVGFDLTTLNGKIEGTLTPPQPEGLTVALEDSEE